VNGTVQNEGFILREPGFQWRPFPISYRTICPKTTDASNLITPTCPSASVISYSYVRIEHTFWQLGQACADTAHLAIGAGNIPLRNVPYDQLKKLIDKQGIVSSAKDAGAPYFDDSKDLPPVSLGM
jgi:hypothetical protein